VVALRAGHSPASRAGACPYLVGWLLVRSELPANGAKCSGPSRAECLWSPECSTYRLGPRYLGDVRRARHVR
jgi:hypothetical protein